jgi:hypothetical protein
MLLEVKIKIKRKVEFLQVFSKFESRYGISDLTTTVHLPLKQHLQSRPSKSYASKKGTVHKRRHRPIK